MGGKPMRVHDLVAVLVTPAVWPGNQDTEWWWKNKTGFTPKIYYKRSNENHHYFQYSIQKQETNKVEQAEAGYEEAHYT